MLLTHIKAVFIIILLLSEQCSDSVLFDFQLILADEHFYFIVNGLTVGGK